MGKYDDKKVKDIQKGFDKTTRSIIDGFNKSGMSGDAYAKSTKKLLRLRKNTLIQYPLAKLPWKVWLKAWRNQLQHLGKLAKL